MDGEARTAPFGKVAAVTTVPLLSEVTLLAVDDVVDEAYVPVDDADDEDDGADVEEGTSDDASPLVECPVAEPPAPPTADGTDPGKAGMS